MIEIQNLTKRYGDTLAVDDLSFTVRPGVVTGFLGPNGAGKSTTMRAVLGLDRPTSGRALVAGRSYADLPAPITAIGALLDAKALDRGRSARSHLRAIAATAGIGARRVDQVLELVGLTSVARHSAGGFSLGMGQRLGLAAALLGDPEVVVLDEPTNGLDPDGILWIRTLMRDLAAQGRTVLVSSHLMSEMELTADHLVVIGHGRLVADQPIHELLAGSGVSRVTVRTPQRTRLAELLTQPGVTLTRHGADGLEVTGLPAAEIGARALRAGTELHELHTVSASLEDAYMELTRTAVGYRGTTPAHAAATVEGPLS